MKKITSFLLLLCVALMGATTASAETIKLTTSNGLPGQLNGEQYTFESEALTAQNPFKYMRLTFFDTYGHSTNADNFKFVCISEFYLEDANGNEIPLTVENFSTNAQETKDGEGPMANICDDNTGSSNYWHSTWSSAIGEYHYLQIALPESMDPISTYKLKWITRNKNNAPISLAVTTGNTAEEITNEVKSWQWTEGNGHVFKLLQSGNGLPGTLENGQYSWTSDLLTYDTPIKNLIFRVIGTNTGASLNGYPFFTLSEIKVSDENGNPINLTTDNLSCNAIYTAGTDGGGLPAVCDNNNSTFLHTAYDADETKSTGDPGTYHYLKIKLPEAMSKLKVAFISRNANNVPKCVELEAYAEDDIQSGVYRIVSANSTWANNLKAITGSLNGQSCNAGWEGVDENDPEQYWTLTKNQQTDFYTLQNTHFGDKKFLTTNKGKGQKSTLVDNGAKYTLHYLGDGQYNIYVKGSEFPIHCANQADGYAQSALTTWAGGANTASAWKFVKVNDYDAGRASLSSIISSVPTSTTVTDNAIGTNPGQINTNMTLEELKTAVTNRENAVNTATAAKAGTDFAEMETAYTALVAAKAAIPAANAIEPNKYYRLKGCASGTYAVATNAGTQMTMAALSDDNKATTIFYLDGNKLLSYNNGYYVYQTREIGALGNSCTWTISPNTNKLGTMTLQAGGTTAGVGTWMYDNFTNKGVVDRYGGPAGDNTNWYIEAVDKLPVSISAARYATIYAPVALTIPNGVEAYAAEFTDGKVMLTPVEATIPANTGVVLEGNKGTYDFAITTTDANVNSALSGNKATANVADDATAYILSKGTQGVGFYKLNSTERTIQGGRAFYTVPASTEETAAIAFIFGGEVTGINNAVSNDAQSNAPIYDLTGRKVAKAIKGGLYIQNGRKFIVK